MHVLQNTSESFYRNVLENIRVFSLAKESIKVKDQELEEVYTFTYSGSVVDAVGGTEADIKARMSKARVTFNSSGKV